jgi:methyl-accepting chemotaxis protein
MNQIDRDRLTDRALSHFDAIHSLQTESQERVTRRMDFIYRFVFIGFGLVVAAIFFMVLVLSMQMSHMTQVITIMNTHFSGMNDDMQYMLGAMSRMDGDVSSMMEIVERMDQMNSSVNGMSSDMATIRERMEEMDEEIIQLGASVTRMRDSFGVMNGSMSGMTRDVHHMSRPMQMFNMMNPFR